MFDLLSNYQGKQIAVGLASGATLAGTLIEVGQQSIRLETGQGTCAVIMSAIQAIWEKTDEPVMEALAFKEGKIPEADQACRQTYTMPCTQTYTQPCYQMYGQPGYPCYSNYAQSEPYGDPRFGYGRPGYGRPGYGRPGFGFPFPYPYPYPPYPYPYPYPPYPYPYDETQEMAGQAQNTELEQK